MKLYIECYMGAAGDMLMAALLELLPEKELFLRRMRSLGLPGVQIEYQAMTKCGITGTKMRIHINGVEEGSVDANTSCQHEHNHEHKREHTHEYTHYHADVDGGDTHEHASHTHYSYQEVCSIIQNLDLAENVKKDALGVYALIGEAEAAVHGVPIDQIHFHEVGSFDAIVDIVGCSLLFQMLGASCVEASPVHVGSGFVRCDHGILPVPCPATAHILKGVPIYSGKIKGELCTPTGAALLRHFVNRFGDMEPMVVTKIGYGMGTKDFEAANCVRTFLSDHTEKIDSIAEISCNLDDMTPEAIGFATELLLESGALDVFTTPINMKKNRPAIMLTCLCKPDDQHHIAQLILRHTTTLGVRYQTLKRDVMTYTTYKVQTPYGEIRIKSANGYDLSKQKPEYEDIRAAALANNIPFSQVYAAAVRAMK
jgi:pyridinium-3,5-bisthiocarboxylic acid mononucleotide nickel chelatase